MFQYKGWGFFAAAVYSLPDSPSAQSKRKQSPRPVDSRQCGREHLILEGDHPFICLQTFFFKLREWALVDSIY